MRRFSWFKFYTEALDDVKLASFTDSQWRCWWSLVGIGRDSSEPGVIRMSAAEIGWRLRKTEDWVRDGVAACERVGLIVQEPGVIRIVKFVDRQAVGRNPESPEALAERKRRSREKQRRAGHDGHDASHAGGHAPVTQSRTLDKRRVEKSTATTTAAFEGGGVRYILGARGGVARLAPSKAKPRRTEPGTGRRR